MVQEQPSPKHGVVSHTREERRSLVYWAYPLVFCTTNDKVDHDGGHLEGGGGGP